jgi:Sulfotransferase family
VRISTSNRFILFHLPRTGVGSVIASLDDEIFVRSRATRTSKLISKHLPFIRQPIEQTYFRTHDTAAHVRRLLGSKTFYAYRRIAFVRNPYSWLVSFYEVLRASPRHRHYAAVAAMTGFGDYVDWEIARNRRRLSPYVVDRKGGLLVDTLGRYEQLEEDTNRIFGPLGITPKPLPHLGQYTPSDYREYYDAAIRRKVAAHWARDLELFGYGFDGIAADAALS